MRHKIGTPTPIITMNYSDGFNRFFIKRDDLLPFSFGGNKVRIANEYFNDMLPKGCNCIISYGSSKSNLNRVIANMSRTLEIPCYIVSPLDEALEDYETFNSRLIKSTEARLVTCDRENVSSTIENVMEKCKREGLKPYYIYGDKYGNGNQNVPIPAYIGLGIWALVIQQISNQISISIIMWFSVKWRPQLYFSFAKIKVLFSFGWKLLASSLLNVFELEIRTLFIGKLYSSSALGFYNRGEQFPKLIVYNINGSIQSVMLPTLSAHQDNRRRAKEMMRRAIVTSSFLVFPMMIGMAVVAEPLVLIVLTEKWLPAVPFLQIFSISYALIPIHTANLQAINAMGRSDIFLKLEIIKKVIGLIILGISIPFGVYAIAIGQVISGMIATFINAYPNKQLLNYSYKEQLMDILPSFSIALIMGAVVSIFNKLNISEWGILILQVCAGVTIYLGLAKIFKLESFGYLVNTIRELMTINKNEPSN